MIPVATFDILPTDDFFPEFFPDLPEDDAFTDKFDRMDIGSRYLVMNMGTMLLVFTFYVGLLFIYPGCRFIRKEAKCAKRNTKKIHKMLFWSHPIVFLQEGYMDILITSMINLIFVSDGLEWSNPSLLITNLLSFFMIASCIYLFFFVLFYLWPRFDELKTSNMKKRFLPAYEMLNLRHGKWTMLFPLVFMLRRILFVIAVCFLMDYTEAQVMLFMAPTMLNLSILAGVHPLEDLPTNRMETFNSCMVMSMIYCLLCFTPLALDPGARYLMGFMMIGLVGFNILVNIVVVSITPARHSCLRCKSRYAKRRKKCKTCCNKSCIKVKTCCL